MSIQKWLSYFKFGSYAAVFYLLISGCTMSNVYTDPNELFQHTLNELSMAHYDIQWEDQGSIINQHALDMNWNPLEDTERFQKGASTIAIDQDLSDQQTIVVSATLDNDTSKEVLLDQLHNQMSAIRTHEPIVHKSMDSQLSQADITKMTNEITAYIDQANRQLLTRLGNAQVHTTMQLWVDRITEKPIRFTFNTAIDYMEAGQYLKESISDSFLIYNVE